MIQDLVEVGTWKPWKFGRANGPRLSHISFANYLVLIAEASLDQPDVIQRMLAEFCAKWGQEIVLFKKN